MMTATYFKAARQELGLSVNQMALDLNLSILSGPRMIRRWEAGTHAISGPAETAVRLMLQMHRQQRS